MQIFTLKFLSLSLSISFGNVGFFSRLLSSSTLFPNSVSLYQITLPTCTFDALFFSTFRFTNDKDITIIYTRAIYSHWLVLHIPGTRASGRGYLSLGYPITTWNASPEGRHAASSPTAERPQPTRRQLHVNSLRSSLDGQRASESENDACPSLIRPCDVATEYDRDWWALDQTANRHPEEIQTVHLHDCPLEPPPRTLLYFACVVIVVAPVARDRKPTMLWLWIWTCIFTSHYHDA